MKSHIQRAHHTSDHINLEQPTQKHTVLRLLILFYLFIFLRLLILKGKINS